MSSILVVGCGGFIGASLRYLCTAGIAKLYSGQLPIATFAVNLLGSFLIGFLSQWFALFYPEHKILRLFMTTGILGGFTTFSTFSLETADLFQIGSTGIAFLNITTSAACCILGAFAGRALANVAGGMR